MNNVLVPRHIMIKLFHLYNVCYHQIATVDIEDPVYNGISIEDTNAVDGACEEIELYEQEIRELLGEE